MILAVDQGTTSTRACLVAPDGRIVEQRSAEHRQILPGGGRVEHDAEEIWRDVERLVGELAPRAQALALANQGETVLIWDRASGRPLHHALVWQDTRTQPFVDELANDAAFGERVRAITGLRLDAYFSAPKLRWLLDEVPGARALADDGRLCAGTLDSWLIWKLSDGRAFITDASTAARTLLYDLDARDWSGELLERFRIPRAILPAIGPSVGPLAETRAGLPLYASLVDQPAALAGQGGFSAGASKATYGTGCFVFANVGERRPRANALLSTVAWQRSERTTFALDGGVLTAGALIDWMVSRAGWFADAAELSAQAGEARDAGGVVCVPALAGLGAPRWRRQARAAWLGLALDSTRAQLARAALEGIACRVAQIVGELMSECSLINSLRADGGLTRSAPLMQLQADLLGVPVEVSAEREATALGAAFLAGRALGLWLRDDQLAPQIAARFEPRISADERASRLDRFERACRAVEELA
jgi:glycerol kinase